MGRRDGERGQRGVRRGHVGAHCGQTTTELCDSLGYLLAVDGREGTQHV